MAETNNKKRWPLALVIIAAVVIAAAAIIYSYHDSPGRLPVSAISDGSNGIIVAWRKDTSFYAQRVDPSGQQQWEAGGIFICECPPGSGFTLTPDGLGGAIITWSNTSSRPDDRDDPAFFDSVPFYSQRINADGELLWSDSPISSGRSRQVVLDGTGGAFFVWDDYKTYRKALRDDYLRLQKIAPDGSRLWGDEGMLIVTSSLFRPVTPEETASGVKGIATRSWPTYEGNHAIVNDGVGGVIVFWEEELENKKNGIYAQRVDGDGNLAWPDRVLVGAGQDFHLRSVVSDGVGGAIIRTSDGTVYSGIGKIGVPLMVHISGDGELLETREYSPDIISISDGLSGSFRIRIEEDPPSGPPRERRTILYVQRLDEAGQALWPEKQVINPGEKQQFRNLEYIADGTGGVIIAWQLQKEFVAYGKIMAQRLDASGGMQWSEEGMPVFNIPGINYQGVSEILSDGSGGVIVVANLGEGGLSGDMVYAQRLDVNGNRLWGDGVRIDR